MKKKTDSWGNTGLGAMILSGLIGGPVAGAVVFGTYLAGTAGFLATRSTVRGIRRAAGKITHRMRTADERERRKLEDQLRKLDELDRIEGLRREIERRQNPQRTLPTPPLPVETDEQRRERELAEARAKRDQILRWAQDETDELLREEMIAEAELEYRRALRRLRG